jgi:ABC-type transporter Mla subunit MlaD
MMPRTYSAAVATPTEQHMIDRNDMISAVQQHMSQLEQRMQVKIREQIQQHAQQQEQRLAHTERTAKQLADTTSTLVDRVDELAKKSADTDAKLDRIMEQEERIVGRLTTEIRGSISSMLGGNRNE